jgi:septal ring factor EnvC (AmiA/AmiB activator)
MIYVKVKQMNKIDELEKEIENLEVLIKKAKTENALLKDEVDSLWAMMDEITKSDIENFSHILDEIKADVITRALMVSKKKVDC